MEGKKVGILQLTSLPALNTIVPWAQKIFLDRVGKKGIK